MERIEELIRGRRSVRTFDGAGLRKEDLEKLTAFMGSLENPYGIAVACRLLDGKASGLSCPMAAGAEFFAAGKVARVAHGEEAFGYSLETLVLYAQSLGIGSVWVGGTMDRPAFQAAAELGPGERMPCMIPLGYPAQKPSLKESLMRKGIRADSRVPFERLFFNGSFDVPLTPSAAGVLARPLEMARWAPSAVNKQPWRAVAAGNAVHFYLRHAGGFVSDPVGDMQKIDMGIALCHFALTAREDGLAIRFSLEDPGLSAPPGVEYIASYTL